MLSNLFMNRKFLIVIGLLYLLASVLGFISFVNGNFNGISWVFTPLGIFIWGDALILGPFITLTSVVLWIKNNHLFTGLFFSSFFTIRWFFEIVYSMMAQFSRDTRPWEIGWKSLPWVQSIGVIEVLVLFQLVYTCLTIISFLSLLYFVKSYLKK